MLVKRLNEESVNVIKANNLLKNLL
jgi:hypothetical protein